MRGKRVLLDSAVLVLSLWATYLLRFEFAIPSRYFGPVLAMTPAVRAIQTLALRRHIIEALAPTLSNTDVALRRLIATAAAGDCPVSASVDRLEADPATVGGGESNRGQ